MIFHENRLLADDSHEISYLIFFENWEKFSQNLSSATVVIGTLRVKSVCWVIFRLLLSCAGFFKIILPGTLSECQTDLGPDQDQRSVWVQTIRKSYQQRINVTASKERVKTAFVRKVFL